MSARNVIVRLPRYLWAAPCSTAGLIIVSIAVLLGAKAEFKDGTLQVVGGRLATWISRLPTRLSILAFTYGHVIYAINQSAMDANLRHEFVHVKQYEMLGPLFPILYIGSSLIQKFKGRDPYFANWFEQQARKVDESPTDGNG
jgi:hypothetical protein